MDNNESLDDEMQRIREESLGLAGIEVEKLLTTLNKAIQDLHRMQNIAGVMEWRCSHISGVTDIKSEDMQCYPKEWSYAEPSEAKNAAVANSIYYYACRYRDGMSDVKEDIIKVMTVLKEKRGFWK